MKTRKFASIFAVLVAAVCCVLLLAQTPGPLARKKSRPAPFDKFIVKNSARMLEEGRETFRFDTFGDEAFWGDALQLHKAIEGSRFGGVGGGLSPAQALALGLKVDVDALTQPTAPTP
jgi:hypothetical protein